MVNILYLPLRFCSYILLHLLYDINLPYLLFYIIICLYSVHPYICVLGIIAVFYIIAKGFKQYRKIVK